MRRVPIFAKALCLIVAFGLFLIFAGLAEADTVTLYPNGAEGLGSANSFETWVGVNPDAWQTNDGDTSYAQGDGNNVRQTAHLDNPTVTGDINSVTVYAVLKSVSSAENDLAILIYALDGGGVPTDVEGTEFGSTLTYATYSYAWTTNPASGAAWTWADIDALEAGIDTDVLTDVRVTQVYVFVDYTPSAAATVTASSSGTQTASIEAGSTAQYIGAAFTFQQDTGTADTITALTISETGSVDADAILTTVKVYYEDGVSSCTYNGTESFYDTSFNASDQIVLSSISIPVTLSTNYTCVYVVFDVSLSAINNSVIDLEITSSADFTLSGGSTKAGTYPVALSGSTTITDTTAPAEVTGLSITSGDSQLDLSWTNPGDSDYTGVRISRATGATPPADCTSFIAEVAAPGISYNDSPLTNGQEYSYRLCTYDEVPNYSSGATGSGTPSAAVTTTVGDGVDPSNASLCPGDGITDMDSFTLQTSSGTDDVTDVTVSLAAGTYAGLSNIAITSDDGATTYGSVADPASDAVTITTTGLTATTTSTPYKVRVTPKSHANMPAPPGSTYSVTGTVTAITSTNTKSYEEVDSAAVAIDNASPSNATWGTITPGDGQIELNWTNPADADFNQVVILRNTATISDTPVEGSTYIAGNTIGTSTVVYVGALQTFTDTGVTNGTDYYYKIFANDTCINYATGSETGQLTPSTDIAPTLSYPASPYDNGKDPDTGDTTTDITFKVIYTDTEGDAPASGYPKIYIGDNDGFFSYTMSLDTTADAALQDGDYTNGEQYVYGAIGPGAAEDLRFYFEAQAASGNQLVVTLPSNAPTGYSTASVYLLWGYNMVGVPKDLGTGLSYTSVLGDDSGLSYCLYWNSTGLDVGEVSYGSWVNCTSKNVETSRGYFIWSTASNTYRLDEPTGVGNVAAAYVEIDLQAGWNMISNPYNKRILLQAASGPRCTVVRDGSESTDYNAAVTSTPQWIGSTIYEYEGLISGYVGRAYNDSPPAVLEPWAGYWIYVPDDTFTTSMKLRVYQ